MDIFQILNEDETRALSGRADALGQAALAVLNAANPEEVFCDLARAYLANQSLVTRRACITKLAVAFGAERKILRDYLRSKGICGERD
jgi:hypothetical protein